MRYIYTIMAVITMLSFGPAHAASMDIVAVVGEDAISSYDLDSRMRFVIVTTKLSNTPEVLSRIAPQVLQGLIDEKLQLQEARRKGIEVADGEIGPAVAVIEERQGMEKGTLFGKLEAVGVPKETFAEQIRAQIAWSKLLSKVVRPRVKVSNDEVERLAGRSALPALNQEWQITVLALPVAGSKSAKEMQQLAEKLVKEVREGANFEEVARQFSSGDLNNFWVRPEQLDTNIAKAVQTLRPGGITDPIVTEQGFSIVKLYNVRATKEETPSDASPAISEEERKRADNFIFQQKMNLEGLKYIRALRRDTFVEFR